MTRGSATGTALAVAALAALGGQQVAARQGSRDPGQPRCEPTSLNRPAQLPHTPLTVSPLPGSYDASPHTQISLLGAPAGSISAITVRGSKSGAHVGRLVAYSQGDGESFLPSEAFKPGEVVTVGGDVRSGSALRRFAYSFTVSQPDPLPYAKPSPKPPGKAGDVQSFHSQPALHPPTAWVSKSVGALERPGYVFAAPYSGPGQNGPMIFDSAGQLVWFHPLPFGTEATNFRVQSYEGRPVLSWWQGYIPPQGFGEGEEVVADSYYRTILQVHAGNGYAADLHDFHLMAGGTALLTVFNPIRCNLSYVGGHTGAAVTDGVFQELDLRTGLVRREWHSVDHVSLADSYASAKYSNTVWPFDYFHINTVEPMRSGNLLVSSRNTSAMYVVDPATAQITLRIGGKHSSLKPGAGAATAYQHDAQELANGQLSIFDNGGVPMVHKQSRGLIVAINSAARSETLVREFVHPAPLQAASQGNMQPLEGGNVFIGWGSAPYFSEFTPDGKLIFDVRLPYLTASYRGYRFQWEGTPQEPPAIAATGAKQAMTVYASWNGATGVAAWRLLGGASPGELTPFATARRSGFETAIHTTERPAYLAVQALGASGQVLGTSRTIRG